MAVKIDKGYVRKADGTLLQLSAGHLVTAGGAIRVFPQTVDLSAAVITLGAALTYNGSTQTKKVASVVLEGVTLTEGVDYTVSGNTGKNAGNYTLTVTGIGDYEGSVTAAWSIAVLKLTKPTVSGSFTYNGSAWSCTVSGMNSTYITQSGTASATNAGTYTVTFTLKDTANTAWEDGATAAVSYTWSIARATGKISVSPTSMELFGAAGTAKTAAISYTGDGAISVASNKTSVATVTRSGSTVTVKSVADGSATITITLAAGTNYTGASCTIGVTVNTSLIIYNGTYTKLGSYTIDGAAHTLYQLTGSGTMSLYTAVKYWMTGAGGCGSNPVSHAGGSGAGGGHVASGTLGMGTFAVVIGAGSSTYTDTDYESNGETGGTTSIGSLTAAGGEGGNTHVSASLTAYTYGGDGASGGGSGGFDGSHSGSRGIGGMGDGVSTYPFGIEELYAHSAGGGGGEPSSGYYGPGTGGSNGSDGGDTTYRGWSTGADGGERGGGGGSYPYDASFYGSGGGGYSGSGYQGVVYIAIPA